LPPQHGSPHSSSFTSSTSSYFLDFLYFLIQRFPLSEPRPLDSLHIPRQGPLLGRQLLRPLPRFFFVPGKLQIIRIVVKRFRSRRILRRPREIDRCLLEVSRARIGVSEQSCRAVIIEFRVLPYHPLPGRNSG